MDETSETPSKKNQLPLDIHEINNSGLNKLLENKTDDNEITNSSLTLENIFS